MKLLLNLKYLMPLAQNFLYIFFYFLTIYKISSFKSFNSLKQCTTKYKIYIFINHGTPYHTSVHLNARISHKIQILGIPS